MGAGSPEADRRGLSSGRRSPPGAQEANGANFTTYQGLGAEGSRLGMPVRGHYAVPGGWATDFQGGRITFDSTTEETEVTFA